MAVESIYIKGENYRGYFEGRRILEDTSSRGDHAGEVYGTEYHFEGIAVLRDNRSGEERRINFSTPRLTSAASNWPLLNHLSFNHSERPPKNTLESDELLARLIEHYKDYSETNFHVDWQSLDSISGLVTVP